jgi:hypothetical protein
LLQEFKHEVCSTHPELRDLSDLANAYNRVRERNGQKQAHLPWAKDLQKPQLRIEIDLRQRSNVKVDADYKFEGPTSQHLQVFHKPLGFWMTCHNDPSVTLSQFAAPSP